MSHYSKEQIALALQKKKECNARAQQIVEQFLDPVPLEKVDFFLSSVSVWMVLILAEEMY